MADVWQLSPTRSITLDRPRVMAILNATPDSFSDAGRHLDARAAADAAARFVDEGADVLDVGGESTRPGASRVDEDEQIARVVPVIEAIRAQASTRDVPVTIDTTRARVAAAALDAGADAINDVGAGLEDPGVLALASTRGRGVVLMHRLTTPERDSYSDRYERAPEYGDVVAAVGAFLRERAAAALEAGVPRAGVVLDPGLGFGKTVEQNLELIRRTAEIRTLGYPILSGVSRKSFVGRASGLGPDAPASSRVGGSVGLAVAHLERGAMIFRVHDVRMHAEALRAAWGVAGG